ncbi:MAG: hypothetical protein ABIQ04_04020 [Candidatus Saccharimonadales bacterium]
MKHHIIYIPGLGDSYDGFRRRVLSSWRFYGASVEYVPMGWYKGGSYEDRELRIKQAIERAKLEGKTVSLISESAGGAIALNVFSKDTDLHRLISICAVNNPNTPVSPRILARSPSFKTSLQHLRSSLSNIKVERRRDITVLRSLYDPVVGVSDTVIKGVRTHRMLAVGHIGAIAVTLLFYGFLVIRLVVRE